VSIRLHFLEKHIANLLTFGQLLKDLCKSEGFSEQIGRGSVCF